MLIKMLVTGLSRVSIDTLLLMSLVNMNLIPCSQRTSDFHQNDKYFNLAIQSYLSVNQWRDFRLEIYKKKLEFEIIRDQEV